MMIFHRQVNALLWKNWLLQKREVKQTLCEIVLPLVLVALLVWLRSIASQDLQEVPPMTYEEVTDNMLNVKNFFQSILFSKGCYWKHNGISHKGIIALAPRKPGHDFAEFISHIPEIGHIISQRIQIYDTEQEVLANLTGLISPSSNFSSSPQVDSLPLSAHSYTHAYQTCVALIFPTEDHHSKHRSLNPAVKIRVSGLPGGAYLGYINTGRLWNYGKLQGVFDVGRASSMWYWSTGFLSWQWLIHLYYTRNAVMQKVKNLINDRREAYKSYRPSTVEDLGLFDPETDEHMRNHTLSDLFAPRQTSSSSFQDASPSAKPSSRSLLFSPLPSSPLPSSSSFSPAGFSQPPYYPSNIFQNDKIHKFLGQFEQLYLDRLEEETWKFKKKHNLTEPLSTPVQVGIQESVARHVFNLLTMICLTLFRHLYPISMPTSGWKSDPFLLVAEQFFPLVMLLCFVLPSALLVSRVVTEREGKLREVMRMMGLWDSSYYTSWFITYSYVYCLLSFLISLQLTCGLILGSSSLFLIFAWLFLFGLSSTSFVFSLCPLFRSARQAVVVGTVVYTLMQFFDLTIGDTTPTFVQLCWCLIPQVAFCRSCKIILQLEKTGQGLTFNTLAFEPNGLSMLHCYQMFAVDTVLYGLVALYLDQVIPQDFGPRKSLLFCLPYVDRLKGCLWRRSARQPELLHEDHSPDLSRQSRQRRSIEPPTFYQQGQETASRCVYMRGVSKSFKSSGRVVQAMDNLDLTFYDGELTALLGHNGAGKSTALNVLSGVIPSDRGSVKVFGLQLPEDLPAVHQLLGVCPQQLLLWDDLTVYEHVHFFGKLKAATSGNGMAFEEKVETFIADVGLEEKRDVLTRHLSGGMKRKLSVAMAFVGNPSFVILDEPSAGLDPLAREELWSMLLRLKHNRCIILSTHHMDEAEALGDRVAILARGKLKCCGSVFFLKSHYGCHYTLNMTKGNSPKSSAALVGTLKQISPTVEIIEDSQYSVICKLPTRNTKELGALVERLEAEKASLNVSAYGLSVTTLEDIFLSIANDTDENEEESVVEEVEQTAKKSGLMPSYDLSGGRCPPHYSRPTTSSRGDSTMITEMRHPEMVCEMKDLRGNTPLGVDACPTEFPTQHDEQQQPNQLPTQPVTHEESGVGDKLERAFIQRHTSIEGTEELSEQLVGITPEFRGVEGAEFRKLSETRLALIQAKALIHKRMLYARRDWKTVCCQCLMPAYMVIQGLFIFAFLTKMFDMPSLALTPDSALRGGMDGNKRVLPFAVHNESLHLFSEFVGHGKVEGYWTDTELIDTSNTLPWAKPVNTTFGLNQANPLLQWIALHGKNVHDYTHQTWHNFSTNLLYNRRDDSDVRLGGMTFSRGPYDTDHVFEPTPLDREFRLELQRGFLEVLLGTQAKHFSDAISHFDLETLFIGLFHNVTALHSLPVYVSSLANLVLKFLEKPGSLIDVYKGIKENSSDIGLKEPNENANTDARNKSNLRSRTTEVRRLTEAQNIQSYQSTQEHNVSSSSSWSSPPLSPMGSSTTTRHPSRTNNTQRQNTVSSSSSSSSSPLSITGSSTTTVHPSRMSNSHHKTYPHPVYSFSPPAVGNVDQQVGSVTIVNHPFPAAAFVRDADIVHDVNGFTTVMLTLLGFSFVPASIVHFMVRERHDGLKALQYLAGVKPVTYWLSNFLFDVLFFLVPIVGVVCALEYFHVQTLTDRTVFIPYILNLLLFAPACCAQTYFLSFLFRDPPTAQVSLLGLNFALAPVVAVLNYILSSLSHMPALSFLLPVATHMGWLCRVLLPGFCLGHSLLLLPLCSRTPHPRIIFICHSPWTWDIIGYDMLVLAISPFVYLSLTVALETGWLREGIKMPISVANGDGGRQDQEERKEQAENMREEAGDEGKLLGEEKDRNDGDTNENNIGQDLTDSGETGGGEWASSISSSEAVQRETERVRRMDAYQQSQQALWLCDVWKWFKSPVTSTLTSFTEMASFPSATSNPLSSSPIPSSTPLQNLTPGMHHIALRDVSLACGRGELVAVLGPNGAGKSTLLKTLCGELRANRGKIIVAGEDITNAANAASARRLVGYCPQVDSLWDLLSPRDHVTLFAQLRGCASDASLTELVETKLRQVQLIEHADKRAGWLSGGMCRKLCLAIASIGSPPVVLLDEPSSGLDPAARQFIRTLVKSLARESCTAGHSLVLVTTHTMDEAEALADRLVVMASGRIQAVGSTQEIKEIYGKGLEFQVKLSPRPIAVINDLMEIKCGYSLQSSLVSQQIEQVCALQGNAAGLLLTAFADPACPLRKILERQGCVSARVVGEWCLTQQDVIKLQSILTKHFPGSVLVDGYNLLWRFRIPQQVGVARIFQLLESDELRAKMGFAISEFTLSQPTLHQVFNHLAAANHTRAHMPS